MKKKLLTILMMAALSISLIACGGSDEEKPNNEAEQNEEQQKEETPTDDGIIDFEADSFKITYTKHETTEDYEGNPCLIYYFNYTNNGEEASSAMVDTYIQCFQNGIECESAFLTDDNEGINNCMKDIQPGTTLEVAYAYELSDMSEVTLEASDYASFDDEKDVQKITLE